jgi:NADH:ubiquinone reductase (H+-translocating)
MRRVNLPTAARIRLFTTYWQDSCGIVSLPEQGGKRCAMRTRRANLLTDGAIVVGGALIVRAVWRSRNEIRRQRSGTERAGQPVHRVVVVGIGFAGLSAVNRLSDLVAEGSGFEVMLIDRHNYHLFYPLLYQVATGGVEPGSLAYPARAVACDRGFKFLEAEVQGVDLARKRLETDAGPISFDSLILAPGSVTNFFGMGDAMAHAIPLHCLADGERLRNQVVECFELADYEGDPDRRRALLTFVVAGGGATGVELASSLSDMIFTALLPNYCSIAASDVRLVLIESRETLLPGWNARMGRIALENLQTHHVEVLLDTTVNRVADDYVETGAGARIETTTVAWTAGVRAEPIVDQIPGDHGRDGRVRVDEQLELPEHPGIFVVGDAAAMPSPGAARPIPPTARAAIDAGKAAAENAIRRARGQPLRAFVYHSPGDLVSLGRGAAAADVLGVVFDGFIAWIIRRGIYLTNLLGVRNRASVLLNWAFVSLHEQLIVSFEHLSGVRRRTTVITESGSRAASESSRSSAIL